jgi:hypothetical protein
MLPTQMEEKSAELEDMMIYCRQDMEFLDN